MRTFPNKFSYPTKPSHDYGKKGRGSPKHCLPGQACRAFFCGILDLSTFYKPSFWVSMLKYYIELATDLILLEGKNTWHSPQKVAYYRAYINYKPIHGACAMYFYLGVI